MKRFLIHFLNTIIQPVIPIISLIYSNNEQVGEAKESRSVVFDIHCTTATGERYIRGKPMVVRPTLTNYPWLEPRTLGEGTAYPRLGNDVP